MKNKKFKLLGTVLSVLVSVFIVKELLELKIDFSVLSRSDHIALVLLFSFVYGLHMFVLCIPWKAFVSMLTNEPVPFHEASWVLNKSNLMKYLPGNVFQYIGRNELAVRLKLRHPDVSLSTVLDVLVLIGANFLLSVILYMQGIRKWYSAYGLSSIKFVCIALTAILAILVALTLVFRGKARTYVESLRERIRSWKTFCSKIVCGVMFYLGLALIIDSLFALTLYKIVGADLGPAALSTVVGAYALSWVAGFIVPGAPGGIGIREASITLLLSGFAPVKELLLAAVVYRLITIIGDFIGFFLSFACLKIKERKGTARE